MLPTVLQNEGQRISVLQLEASEIFQSRIDRVFMGGHVDLECPTQNISFLLSVCWIKLCANKTTDKVWIKCLHMFALDNELQPLVTLLRPGPLYLVNNENLTAVRRNKPSL